MKMIKFTVSLSKYLLFMLTLFAMKNSFSHEPIKVGAEQVARYLPLIQGKKVALVVNQTSRAGNQHLVDLLLAKKIHIQAVFAPEHGFRGDRDAGEKFTSTIDTKTGIPLISLYGKQRKPTAASLKNIDVIIFDIQDVGVRFYTYISSMHYVMEAALDAGIPFIILDRPNPNGAFVDGPILEEAFSSFVGLHKIPLLHGMTVGELAKMISGEGWLRRTTQLGFETRSPLDLIVIPVEHYQRDMPYHLPIKPSPNLPNNQAIALYPSLGFFEATPVSIGRGTLYPFQVIGHHNIFQGNFSFTPLSTPGAALKPKLINKILFGQDLRKSSVAGINLSYLMTWYSLFKAQEVEFFTHPNFMDKLSGTDKLRKAIIAGQSEQQIKQSWQQGLNNFRKLSKPYLLY